MNSPALWNGKDLKGTWHVTIKIDGVRALWVHDQPLSTSTMGIGHWESRAGKPLYNIPAPFISITTEQWWPGTDCELYLGSLKETIRACRTIRLKPDTPVIRREHLYSLDPLDKRLDLGLVENPTADWINSRLASVNGQGFEGLVLRQGDKWLKVKPHDTYDVRVLGVIEGNGKHKGRLGYIQTIMGDVGTGFSDTEREEIWHRLRHLQIGDMNVTIEVECMQLTPDGKFRHARFIRERFDKIASR